MKELAAGVALGYSSPPAARPWVVLYRVAQVCAVLPLVVGVGTLALYAVTFWDRLPTIGFLTLFGGAGLFMLGLLCLTVFWMELRRCTPDVRSVWSKRVTRVALLLVSNVPIAFLCAWAGIYLMNQFRLTLVNQSTVPITDITINAPGEIITIQRLEPGARRRLLVSIDRDGAITFTAMQSGTFVAATAAGYVTPNHGGRATVRFTNGGPAVTSNR